MLTHLISTSAQSGYSRTILTAIGILIITGAVCLFFQDVHAQKVQLNRQVSPSGSTGPTQSKKSTVHLYFADRDNYHLMAEQRVVSHSGEPEDYARSIVESLIKGPQSSLARTIAAATELRAVYIVSDGTCYVDLSRAIETDHPGGCNSELLTVYSLVNSLILNVPEIKRVKLLIDGKEVRTLAGHIDLEFSFGANMLLIR